MKVSLITIHRALNYGSVLQTYACTRIFKRYGCDTEVLDYIRNTDLRETSIGSLRDFYKHRIITKCPKGIKERMKNFISTVAVYPSTKRFYNLCNNFLGENVHLSLPCYSVEELKSHAFDADVFCAGSDQIWNSDYNNGFDTAYFLSYAPNEKRKIAFSSSMGKEIIGVKEAELMKSYLQNFSTISVREKKTEDILRGMQISSQTVLDPTLLVSRKEWSDLSKKSSIKLPKESYLLIYKLKGNDLIDKIAYQIAQKLGLKVVRITFAPFVFGKDEVIIRLPKVEDFLKVFKNASYVVTNSFHGTCFAINFGKQFISVTRENYNVRIINILSQLHLESRIANSDDNSEGELFSNINYEEVNRNLDQLRRESFEWLEKAFS